MFIKDATSKITRQHVVRAAELACMTLMLIVVLLYLTGNTTTTSSIPASTRKYNHKLRAWYGWPSIENMFVFGDSYSAQSFDCSSTQPNTDNPFGNPATSLSLASGSVWPYFLTLNYNQSYIRTWNLAVGGSVVDSDIVVPFLKRREASLHSQIFDKFKPIYAGKGSSAPWRSDNTLFALWFGINDIVISVSGNKHSPIRPIMTSYKTRLDQLYSLGAKNFLLINVPPVSRAHSKKEYTVLERSDISSWNKELNELRKDFLRIRGDSTVFIFDAHSLWTNALDDHTRFVATQNLKRVDMPCEQYAKGTKSHNQLHPKCKIPVNQFFWLNGLHATYPVHNATAAKIVEDCFAHVEPRGYCL